MTPNANWKPMLAFNGELDVKQIKFPILISPKLDGIRATIQNGMVLGRSLKKVPNKFTQKIFGHTALEGLDGEFTLGSPTAEDVCNVTGIAVGTIEFEPHVTLNVFDHFSDDGFYKRLDRAKELTEAARVVFTEAGMPWAIKMVEHIFCENLEQLKEYEAKWVAEGYEGLMIRSIRGPYKQGRSTQNEGFLMKMKRFVDSEAEVIGFNEQMHNSNPAMTNERGNTARSTCKAGKVPAGTLGAFLVRDIHTGVEFKIGAGGTQEEVKEIWDNRDKYLGKVLKYKSQAVGVKDKPRIPSFVCWREEFDIGEK